MFLRTLVLALFLLALPGCGPYKNTYVKPEVTDGLVRVLIEYKGELVYPTVLYFRDGETCSYPEAVVIKPLSSAAVYVPPDRMASFLLADVGPPASE